MFPSLRKVLIPVTALTSLGAAEARAPPTNPERPVSTSEPSFLEILSTTDGIAVFQPAICTSRVSTDHAQGGAELPNRVTSELISQLGLQNERFPMKNRDPQSYR